MRAGDSGGGVRTSSPCAPEVVGMLLIAIKKYMGNIVKIYVKNISTVLH